MLLPKIKHLNYCEKPTTRTMMTWGYIQRYAGCPLALRSTHYMELIELLKAFTVRQGETSPDKMLQLTKNGCFRFHFWVTLLIMSWTSRSRNAARLFANVPQHSLPFWDKLDLLQPGVANGDYRAMTRNVAAECSCQPQFKDVIKERKQNYEEQFNDLKLEQNLFLAWKKTVY